MARRYFPNLNTTLQSSSGKVVSSWDFTEVNRAIGFMEDNAGKSMADAIKEALRKQANKTQSYIMRESSQRHRVMSKEVADSIAVDIGVTAGGEAQVRFGSEPMDDGGVSGSRGGKLALILEFGIRDFPYPFTIKSIKPSPSFAIGNTGIGNFINAKANPIYKGFEGIGWLAKAFAEVQPEIQDAIMLKLREDFA